MKNKTGMQFRFLLAAWIAVTVGCGSEVDLSRDAIVTGASMAPAFWGKHFQATCDQCGYAFRVAALSGKLPNLLVCPNCGDRSVDSAKAKAQPAQRVRVKPCRDAHGNLKIKRWDVVAVRASGDRPAMIKRVIGLPGESIEFVDGDVFANGRLVRKPPHVARSMRIPVFDSQFFSPDVLRRFAPQSDAENWRVRNGVWSYSAAAGARTHWLAYEQWRCVTSGLRQDDVVPVEDWYEANVNVNRNLNNVKDVWALIEFRAAAECQVEIAVAVAEKPRFFDIDFGAGQASFDGQIFSFKQYDSTAADKVGVKRQPFRIEVCTFDRQLTMTVNGYSFPAVDLPSSDGVTKSVPMIQIGGRETSLVMTKFQLWRDVHYFDDGVQKGSAEEVRLVAGPNEYLLVGDNVPLSVDSRHWPIPAVSGSEILGTIDDQK